MEFRIGGIIRSLRHRCQTSIRWTKLGFSHKDRITFKAEIYIKQVFISVFHKLDEICNNANTVLASEALLRENKKNPFTNILRS